MANREEMSDKELVQELLGRMPDGVSLQEVVHELEFIVAVRQGLSELDENKDSVAIEKFEPKVPSWTVTIGRRRRGRQKPKSGDPVKTKAGRSVKAKTGDSLKSPAPSPSA